MRLKTIVFTLLMLLVGSAARAQDDPRPPTIAVLSFEALPGGRTLPPPQLGVIAAQFMVDQLVSSGRYRVLDGRWLQPGRPGLEALRSNARAANVEYLILGEITRFSTERGGRSLGGLGVLVPVIGGYRRRSTTMAVSVLVSIVDVRTGEIMSTAAGEGTAGRTTRRLGVIGLPGGGGGGNESSDFYDALLDEATQRAIGHVSRGVVAAAARLQRVSHTDTGLAPRLPAGDDDGRGRPVVDRVEQELEGPVGLGAEVDLRPEEQHAPAAERGIDDGHAVFEVLLAQGPSAAKR